jgi:hypothetical protein
MIPITILQTIQPLPHPQSACLTKLMIRVEDNNSNPSFDRVYKSGHQVEIPDINMANPNTVSIRINAGNNADTVTLDTVGWDSPFLLERNSNKSPNAEAIIPMARNNMNIL